MFQKLLSYFIPVNIYRRKSALSKNLEVTWNNGQLVLDSENTNYSYGSLQRVLRKGLKTIGFETVSAMEHILVLGVAGGSVIKTLVDEIAYKGKITGVEIDAEVIRMANTYFGLDQIPNLEIIIDDAFEFVLKTKEKYDLIIIDIFQDTVMPNFLFEKFFANRIGFLLRENGLLLFNTMILNDEHEKRNAQYMAEFDTASFSVQRLPRLESHNELILVQKSL
jgi:spermidine synthase